MPPYFKPDGCVYVVWRGNKPGLCVQVLQIFLHIQRSVYLNSSIHPSIHPSTHPPTRPFAEKEWGKQEIEKANLSLKRANEREGERWCSESCHWCENSMEGSQTLEAIFTSSANSDRLPSAQRRRISAALSLIRSSLFLHFIPARPRYCSSKYPNNMLFFQSWKSVSLAWWGWKWHQMAV